MQSSCILKIIKLFILEYVEEKIYFNFGQFGFMQGMLISHASLLLKEILRKTKSCMLYLLTNQSHLIV